MGIRFYCPQGHKLNVKSFLAGKKGICPHCNAKVDIPLKSTRGSAKKEAAARAAQVVPVGGPAARPGDAAGAVTAPLARPVAAPAGDAPMALLLKPVPQSASPALAGGPAFPAAPATMAAPAAA